MSKSTIWIIICGVVFVGIMGYAIYQTAGAPSVFTSQLKAYSDLPGMQTGDQPWIADHSYLSDRLDAIGLPKLHAEGQALHIHQHLDIFIHGVKVFVPLEIGINTKESYISAIHTHDESGILHVESPVIADFYLGQVFDIWGVRLNSDCVGGYCNSATSSLQVFVNGEKVSGDPRAIKLDAHQEIVITYGNDKEIPSPLPKEYTFPASY